MKKSKGGQEGRAVTELRDRRRSQRERELRETGPAAEPQALQGPDVDERIEDEPPGYLEVEEMDTTIGAASGGYLTDESDENARLRLHDVQVALVAMGYDITGGEASDPTDGIDDTWGPATRDAIAQFQEEHGLPRIGQLDATTYEAILGVYETGLETQSHMVDQDDFTPVQPEHPLNE